ncbi:MAG: hypothetical protein ABSA47_06175 [Verrucomicrobiota bacterium]
MNSTKFCFTAGSWPVQKGLVLLGAIGLTAATDPRLLAQPASAGAPSSAIIGSPMGGLPGGAPGGAIVGTPPTNLPGGRPSGAIVGSAGASLAGRTNSKAAPKDPPSTNHPARRTNSWTYSDPPGASPPRGVTGAPTSAIIGSPPRGVIGSPPRAIVGSPGASAGQSTTSKAVAASPKTNNAPRRAVAPQTNNPARQTNDAAPPANSGVYTNWYHL